MIELFIITAILLSSTFAMDYDTCTEYKRDFLLFENIETNRIVFEYKDYNVDIQILSVGKTPDSLMIPVSYTLPIQECVPNG